MKPYQRNYAPKFQPADGMGMYTEREKLAAINANRSRKKAYRALLKQDLRKELNAPDRTQGEEQ